MSDHNERDLAARDGSDPSPTQVERKPYASPVLSSLGTFAQRTLAGGTSTIVDANQFFAKNP